MQRNDDLLEMWSHYIAVKTNYNELSWRSMSVNCIRLMNDNTYTFSSLFLTITVPVCLWLLGSLVGIKPSLTPGLHSPFNTEYTVRMLCPPELGAIPIWGKTPSNLRNTNRISLLHHHCDAKRVYTETD